MGLGVGMQFGVGMEVDGVGWKVDLKKKKS